MMATIAGKKTSTNCCDQKETTPQRSLRNAVIATIAELWFP